jgi:hypothetical protein
MSVLAADGNLFTDRRGLLLAGEYCISAELDGLCGGAAVGRRGCGRQQRVVAEVPAAPRRIDDERQTEGVDLIRPPRVPRRAWTS